MQIKGTTIALLSCTNGELTTDELIDDVLIGEKNGAPGVNDTGGHLLGYTLAIPKGDMHDWVDRFVEFFGYCFRTVGFPEQGIEENIPLRWHKKVKVELADVSGVCTLYESRTYARHIFNLVCIRDHRGGTSVAQDGSRVAGRMKIRIYSPLNEGEYIPKAGDMIIPCECCESIDTTSEQTISRSIKEIKEAHPEYGAVTEVSFESFGRKSDIIIEAR